MSRWKVPPPANDEGQPLRMRVEGLDGPPLSVAEVEIFDALVSNIPELVAANDNAPPMKEKTP